MKIAYSWLCSESLWGQTRMEGGRRGAGSPSPILPSFSAQRWPHLTLPTHISQGTQCAAAVMSISRDSVSVARHHKGFVSPYGFKSPRGVSPRQELWWAQFSPAWVGVPRCPLKMTYTPSTDISLPQKVTQPQLMPRKQS